MKYAAANFGRNKATRMQIVRIIPAKDNAVGRSGTISAIAIPAAAINANPANG